MSTEQNKAASRRWHEEGWNKRNLDLTDEIYAADCIWPDGGFASVEHLKNHCADFIAGFPDSYMTVEEQLADGDRVTTRWTLRGTHTHKAKFLGIAPTGKEVTMRGIIIQRFANGRVVEQWEGKDVFGLLRQLGMIQAPWERKE